MDAPQVARILLFRTAFASVFDSAVEKLRLLYPEAVLHVICREAHREETQATEGVSAVTVFPGEKLSREAVGKIIAEIRSAGDVSLCVVLLSNMWGEGYENVMEAVRLLTGAPVVGYNAGLRFISAEAFACGAEPAKAFFREARYWKEAKRLHELAGIASRLTDAG